MNASRQVAIDVARCIMNYMVILLHAWAAFQYVKWGDCEFILWTFICSHVAGMAIPSFFLISGYLLFKNFSLRGWPSKIYRRIKRLAIPYLAWNIVFVLFYLGLSQFVPRLAARVASFGLNTFDGAISKIISLSVHPIDGPLWFIRALLFLSIASPIIYMLLSVVKGLGALILCMVWCIVEVLMGYSESLMCVMPSYAVACFVAGGVIARAGKDLATCFRSWVWIAAGMSLCIARASIVMPTQISGECPTILAQCFISLAAVFEAPALMGIISRLKVDSIVKNKVYVCLAQMSYFAYAGHFLFCSMWLHSVAPFLKGYWHCKFTVLITIFVAFGTSTMVAVYYGGRRMFPKAIKVFDGNL